jgi:hypothetical protein
VQADRRLRGHGERHQRHLHRVRDADLQPGLPGAVILVPPHDVAFRDRTVCFVALGQLGALAVPIDGQLLWGISVAVFASSALASLAAALRRANQTLVTATIALITEITKAAITTSATRP